MAIAALLLGGLLFSLPGPAQGNLPRSTQGGGAQSATVAGDSLESQLLRGLSQGASLGPGMFAGPANANPTVYKALDSGMASRRYSFHIQNLGDNTLQLVKHSGGSATQLTQIPASVGQTAVLNMSGGASLQVLGLGDGTETRFVWSAREVL